MSDFLLVVIDHTECWAFDHHHHMMVPLSGFERVLYLA